MPPHASHASTRSTVIFFSVPNAASSSVISRLFQVGTPHGPGRTPLATAKEDVEDVAKPAERLAETSRSHARPIVAEHVMLLALLCVT